MIDKIIPWQIKYFKILLILSLIFVSFFAYKAQDLQIDPDFGSLIPDDSQYNKNNNIFNNAFEVNDAIVIFISKDKKTILKNIPNDMEDMRVSDYLSSIQKNIIQSQYVRSVSDPIYSEDKLSAQIIVYLSTPKVIGSTKLVKNELENILNQVGSPVGINTIVTGMPIMMDRIPTLLIQDNLNTILITIIAIFIILYFYSRDIYFSFITISIPIVSLIILAGSMVILNISVTLTLAAVGVLILGLGADYAIHISTHYSELRNQKMSHREAMVKTSKDLQLPITASFITTLAGFAALILGVSPSSQAQGIVLSLGITIIYLTTFGLFPILMTIFANHIQVKPNFVFEKILVGLGKLASYQVRYAKIILWCLGLITIIMIFGATKIQISTSTSNWIPDGDEIATSNKEMELTFGGSESLKVLLISEKGDLRDVQVQRDINILKSQLEGIPNVDSVTTPYDGINYDSVELFEAISYDPDIRGLFNSDFTLSYITIKSRDPGQDDSGNSILLKSVKEITDNTNIHNTKISLYGNLVRFDELKDNLQKDTGITTLIGLGLVFFVASTIYASITIGILALIPIIIAVIWAIGLMGFFNVPFTSLSTGIISLVLGVGIDFSIHLVDSIKRNVKNLPFPKAVYETMTTSGKAIFISSLTTFVGFVSLTFAKLLGTQRLGWALAFSILSVFIVSILLVPCIMSIMYKRNKKKI